MGNENEFDMLDMDGRFKSADKAMREKENRNKTRKYLLEAAKLLSVIYPDVNIAEVSQALGSTKGWAATMAHTMATYYTHGPLEGALVYTGVGVELSDLFGNMIEKKNRLWNFMVDNALKGQFDNNQVNIIFKMRRGKHLWIMTNNPKISTAVGSAHMRIPSKQGGLPDVKILRVDQLVYTNHIDA